ncbi:hypothetical protein AMC99_00980 [Altererythrobacter epoxidivorans]|uniref:Cell division protein ZapA n=1 Tax=Altererythrobacter epoxidivorans TaxID=361183 RepID=A0A0M4LTW2_9SPHN|nr:cell division protein ZapA [Altererythrobacter epoxidivorans]ALE16279.1 hypothetical protein AMC99_00980 [Altererythrobacter epoxidivorans]
MSQVTLQIAGRNYTVACADGEEAQVRHLGQVIDEKLAKLGGNLSNAPAQNLLFAALLLADEVDESRKSNGSAIDAGASDETAEKLKELQLELYALKAERDAMAKELARYEERKPAKADVEPSDATAPLLEMIAEKLEKSADLLEATTSGS